jgi:hypothetical protein
LAHFLAGRVVRSQLPEFRFDRHVSSLRRADLTVPESASPDLISRRSYLKT